MPDQATPSPTRRDTGAPTLAELLHEHRVPDHLLPAVRRAVGDWLNSWNGCTPTNATADETLAYLRRMLWGHR